MASLVADAAMLEDIILRVDGSSKEEERMFANARQASGMRGAIGQEVD